MSDAAASVPAAAAAAGALLPARETFGDLWVHAGPTAWLCLLMLAATTALAVECALRFRFRALVPDEERIHLRALLAAGCDGEALDYCRGRLSFLCAVTEAALGLRFSSVEPGAQAERLAESCRRQAALVRRPLLVFSLVGVLAPLVGLTGSVVGIARAFSGFAGAGREDSLVPLAGAIGPVLTSTACGLIAAIPAFVAYFLFRSRADLALMEAESAAFELFPGMPRRPRSRSQRSRRDEDRDFGLQIAPLIDLLFVLLLFFMVIAAGRGAESELPLRLATLSPATAAAKTKPPEAALPLRIEIDAAGQVFFNRVPIDGPADPLLPGLRARLAEAVGKKIDVPVLVLPSPKAKQNRVIAVLQACQICGVRHISFGEPVQ